MQDTQAAAETGTPDVVQVPLAANAAETATPLARFPADAEILSMWRLAKALAASGYFADARQATQAFAKLVFGRDLGLSVTASMTNIHIIDGRPELSANLQAQLLRSWRGPDGERYDYRVTHHSDEECEIAFLRAESGGELSEHAVERYSAEDAARAGLAGKTNHQRFPRNMLFARCMSNGIAFHCPEVTSGVRVYSAGELERPVDQAGERPALTLVRTAAEAQAARPATRLGELDALAPERSTQPRAGGALKALSTAPTADAAQAAALAAPADAAELKALEELRRAAGLAPASVKALSAIVTGQPIIDRLTSAELGVVRELLAWIHAAGADDDRLLAALAELGEDPDPAQAEAALRARFEVRA